MGAAVVPAPVPAGGKIRAKSVEGVLARTLEFGEPVLFQANVLRRTHAPLFESAIVVLTDRRLLLLTQVFPSGYELKAQHASAACSLINHKERFDGSRIVAIRTEDKKTLCLYFGRLWRAQAEWICQALPEANAATELAATPVEQSADGGEGIEDAEPAGHMDQSDAVEEFLALDQAVQSEDDE